MQHAARLRIIAVRAMDERGLEAAFPPDEAVLQATDWSSFEPCPASSPA